jgi:copper(I)-binding protein
MMKHLITNSGLAFALLIAPAMASAASAGIPSGYRGEFKDPQAQVAMKLEDGVFSNGKVTVSAEGKKVELKVVDVSELKDLALLMAPKVDPKKKPKKPVPNIAAAAAYGIVHNDRSQDLYLVVPTSEQQESSGFIWYTANITIMNMDPKQSAKLPNIQATRCANGTVMIDTMSLDVESAFEIGCSDAEVDLDLKRTK